MFEKSYIETGCYVEYLTRYIAVPKGSDNVRMVYDVSVSGVNAFLWVPSFRLPTLDSLSAKLDMFSFQPDKDLGEMFLNHTLHPSLC